MEPDEKENLLLAMLPEGYNYKFVKDMVILSFILGLNICPA